MSRMRGRHTGTRRQEQPAGVVHRFGYICYAQTETERETETFVYAGADKTLISTTTTPTSTARTRHEFKDAGTLETHAGADFA